MSVQDLLLSIHLLYINIIMNICYTFTYYIHITLLHILLSFLTRKNRSKTVISCCRLWSSSRIQMWLSKDRRHGICVTRWNFRKKKRGGAPPSGKPDMVRKICKHVDLSYQKPWKTIGRFTGMKLPDTKENIKHSEKRTSLSFSPERHLAWGSLSFGGQTCGTHKLMVAWISCSVVVVGAGRTHPLFPSHTHPMLQCDGIPKWALCGVSKWDGYRITGYVLLWRRVTDNVGIGPSVREDSWLDRWCNRNLAFGW